MTKHTNDSLKDAFFELLFMSKIANLNTKLFYKKEDLINLDTNKIISSENLVYYIEIKNKNKKIIIISNYELNNKKNDYKDIYYFLENLFDNINDFSLVTIKWKNQYIVSSIIDLYSGGLILSIPNNLISLKRDEKKEYEINNRIFILYNNWLKKNEDKLNFLTES